MSQLHCHSFPVCNDLTTLFNLKCFTEICYTLCRGRKITEIWLSHFVLSSCSCSDLHVHYLVFCVFMVSCLLNHSLLADPLVFYCATTTFPFISDVHWFDHTVWLKMLHRSLWRKIAEIWLTHFVLSPCSYIVNLFWKILTVQINFEIKGKKLNLCRVCPRNCSLL